jgi:hypothetical protein
MYCWRDLAERFERAGDRSRQRMRAEQKFVEPIADDFFGVVIVGANFFGDDTTFFFDVRPRECRRKCQLHQNVSQSLEVFGKSADVVVGLLFRRRGVQVCAERFDHARAFGARIPSRAAKHHMLEHMRRAR